MGNLTSFRAARPFLWAVLPVLVLAIIYLPDLGHGFVKDDFGWIAGSRVTGLSGILDLFSRQNGFYRPLVSLTFTVNRWLFGLEPFWYGLTNFVLVLLCMAGLALLVLRLGMSWRYGILAASLWGLNFHGVGGAILWISGRTSLLLVLFSLLAAIAVLSGRPVVAASCCLFALLSKEDATLLPLILAAWCGFWPGQGPGWDSRRAARNGLILAIPLGIYVVLRTRTTAYLPWSAPSFYTPTLAPTAFLRNLGEYADRACTFSAVVVLLASLILGRWPRLDAPGKRRALMGGIWLLGGYGLTVFLPVRSSLYACFPSVGAAIASATFVEASWTGAARSRRRALLATAVLVPVALVPVYKSRNVRMVRIAEVSACVLRDLEAAKSESPSGRVLVIHDDPGVKPNLADALGTLMPNAIRLFFGDDAPRVWIDPPPADWKEAGLTPPGGQPVAHYWLRDGRLVQLPSEQR